METSRLDTGSSARITDGPGRQRPGDRDPLQLAAGQLVRVLLEELARRHQVDLLQQLAGPGPLRVAAQCRGSWMRTARCRCVDTREHRVERPVGVLQDQLHVADVPRGRRGRGSAVTGWPRSSTSPRGPLVQPGQDPGQRRLARAGLADQRGDPARVQRRARRRRRACTTRRRSPPSRPAPLPPCTGKCLVTCDGLQHRRSGMTVASPSPSARVSCGSGTTASAVRSPPGLAGRRRTGSRRPRPRSGMAAVGGRTGSSGGTICVHGVEGARAARLERAAGRQPAQVGRVAGDAGQRRAGARSASGTSRAGPGCRGAAGWW